MNTNRASDITAGAAQRQRARALPRLITCHLYAQTQKTFLADAAQKLYPEDEKLKSLVRVVEKAAVTPYSTTSDSGALVLTLISDTISLLAPMSAGLRILDGSLKIPHHDRIHAITVPTVNVSSSGIGPVGEAGAIPVGMLAIDESNALVLYKNALILVASRDLFEKSVPAFSAIINAAATENFALWADVALLGNAAGSSVKSAGLLNGISSLTKSVKTDPLYAMQEDIQSVCGAVSAVAGGGPIVLASGPRTSIKLQQWGDRVGPFEIYGSAAVAEGTIIAIALRGVASSINEIPEIAISKEATLLMDTAPSGPTLSTTGTPNSITAPIRSLLQTDSVGCRFIFGASWLRRSDAAVAFISGITAW